MSERHDPETTKQLQEALDRMSPDELQGVCDYLVDRAGQRASTRNGAFPRWIVVAGVMIASAALIAFSCVAILSRR
jgi:hypothetical protein